jgi:hypothetical protein
MLANARHDSSGGDYASVCWLLAPILTLDDARAGVGNTPEIGCHFMHFMARGLAATLPSCFEPRQHQ